MFPHAGQMMAGGDNFVDIAQAFEGSAAAVSTLLSTAYNSQSGIDKYTVSVWAKLVSDGTFRGGQGGSVIDGAGKGTLVSVSAGNTIGRYWVFQAVNTGSTLLYKNAGANGVLSNAVWYHFVFHLDTTQATAEDRCKVYIDGSLDATADATIPTKDSTPYPYSTSVSVQGRVIVSSSVRFYMPCVILGAIVPVSKFAFDDGGTWTALDPQHEYGKDFGEGGICLRAENGSDKLNNSNSETANVAVWPTSQPNVVRSTSVPPTVIPTA